LARALDVAARRLQVQERLTGLVADAIFQALNPDGVAVELQAEHMCMSMRGVQKPGSRVVTTAVRGKFQSSGVSREELLALLRRR
jgi:GTP cyclohydrolase I